MWYNFLTLIELEIDNYFYQPLWVFFYLGLADIDSPHPDFQYTGGGGGGGGEGGVLCYM